MYTLFNISASGISNMLWGCWPGQRCTFLSRWRECQWFTPVTEGHQTGGAPSESPHPALSYHGHSPNAFQHYWSYQHFPRVTVMVKVQLNQHLHLPHTSEGPPASDLPTELHRRAAIAVNSPSRALSLEDDCICIRLNKPVSRWFIFTWDFKVLFCQGQAFLNAASPPRHRVRSLFLTNCPLAKMLVRLFQPLQADYLPYHKPLLSNSVFYRLSTCSFKAINPQLTSSVTIFRDVICRTQPSLQSPIISQSFLLKKPFLTAQSFSSFFFLLLWPWVSLFLPSLCICNVAQKLFINH